MATRNTEKVQRYSALVSPERQERLQKAYNRQEMHDWAQQTGVHDKVLSLIIAQVRERNGLSPDPNTWRLIPTPNSHIS